MLYHYIASDSQGKFVEGDVDAESVSQVLQYLAGKQYVPVSVKPVGIEGGRMSGFFGKITIADKVFLTKYLALMLRVGTDLLSAINVLIADFDKAAMKNLLLEIRDNLSRGQPFYQAFADHPKEFTSVFVNLVRAAEASGNLQKTFEDLSGSLQRDAAIANRIKGALIYPVIILIFSLAVFTFLVTFALPKIAKVFLDTGLQPPIFSRIVFGIGLFVNDHIFTFIILFIVLFGGGGYFFSKIPLGRRLVEQFAQRAPILKNIIRDLAVQRFATTFSSLMRAGLPIVSAITITADVVGSEQFKAALMRIADEGLSKGLTIGESFRRETIFPRVVTNLVAISEKAGHLEEVLQTVADFYVSSVDDGIKTLVNFLEPMLLLGMGLLVGSIAIAIIVPIYQLTTQF
ncbi:MAG: type II secretion system F family protein [bacterium]|nr:type II secretion system F family protein [bacterium]